MGSARGNWDPRESQQPFRPNPNGAGDRTTTLRQLLIGAVKASSSCFISSSKRLQGAGRSLKDKDFDERLINWVREQRQKKLRVNRTMIQKESLTLSIDENFKASNGWLEKFLLCHNLFSRRPTTTCQNEPEEYAEKIVDYFLLSRPVAPTTIHTYMLPINGHLLELLEQSNR